MITRVINGENGVKDGRGRFIGDGTPNPKRVEIKVTGDTIEALRSVTTTTRERLLAQAAMLGRELKLDEATEWQRVDFRTMAASTAKDGTPLEACAYAVFVPKRPPVEELVL